MTDNNQFQLIPIELTYGTLWWLRNFLYEESLSAEIDHENVGTLHTDVAIRAAKEALNRERAQMTKIIATIDGALDTVAEHESLTRKIAATMPPVA